MVRAHGIPDELVFNWDQTGINLVPGENWTLDKKGDKGCHTLIMQGSQLTLMYGILPTTGQIRKQPLGSSTTSYHMSKRNEPRKDCRALTKLWPSLIIVARL